VGNVVMVSVFGLAALKALRRFQTRFNFTHQPADQENL
jgi:hypothetical protein